MKASAACFDVIKHFEQCRLRAYPDPGTGSSPWTVGWGATGEGIHAGVEWTQLQCDNRLVWDVGLREADANNAIVVPVTQGIFDAFVSALFNIGHGSPAKDGLVRLRSGYPSSCLRLLNAGHADQACEALGKWVSPGSSVEHGLHRRRVAEQALWAGHTAAEAIALGDAA
jgi:lysozyme